METNRTFNVYVASPFYSFRVVNDSDDAILVALDDPSLNGHPERIPVVTNQFVTTANPYPVGVYYYESFNSWVIFSEFAGIDFQVGTGFVVAVDGEVQSFQQITNSDNSQDMCTKIDLPFLNNHPDANLIVTHYLGTDEENEVYIQNSLLVTYSDDDHHWYICNSNFESMQSGAVFNVLYEPGQPMNVNDVAQNNKATAFPNPAFDVVNFHSEINMQQVQIYDLTGKMIMTKDVSGKSLELNIAHLKTGIYIAKIKTDQGTEVLKLVKK